MCCCVCSLLCKIISSFFTVIVVVGLILIILWQTGVIGEKDGEETVRNISRMTRAINPKFFAAVTAS